PQHAHIRPDHDSVQPWVCTFGRRGPPRPAVCRQVRVLAAWRSSSSGAVTLGCLSRPGQMAILAIIRAKLGEVAMAVSTTSPGSPAFLFDLDGTLVDSV